MFLDVVDLVAVACLCLIGLHRLLLLAASLRNGPAASRGGGAAPCVLPVVTVQLPVYNERYVAEELLEAVAQLDYPRGRLEVQVLDDSTDSTSQLIADMVPRLRQRGLDIQHLQRRGREGFKAGALAHGLEQARGELVAVFDADFLPPPGLLMGMVPPFADPHVGLVQARWGHINRGASLLTRIQAMQLDGHFLVEHAGRQNAGLFLNFNGTAGMLRRAAIEEAGGWQSETLTEDLDLSCRAQLRGWRFLYRADLVVPGQLPEGIAAYKSQQRRWTRGSAQTARKLLLAIWRGRLPLRQKLEASALLLGNASYLLLLMFALVHGVSWTLLGKEPTLGSRIFDTYLLGSATGVLFLFYAVAALRADRGIVPAFLEVPALIALGAGMSLNNALAFLQGLFGGVGTFQRTPKSCGDSEIGTYRAPPGLSIWLELPFCAASLACSLVFVSRGWLGSGLFYLLFAFGFGYVGLLSVGEWLGGRPRAIPAASSASPAQTGRYSAATTQAFSSQTPAAR